MIYNLGLRFLSDEVVELLKRVMLVRGESDVYSRKPLLPPIYTDYSPSSVYDTVVEVLESLTFEEGDIAILSAPADVTGYVVIWLRDHCEFPPVVLVPQGRVIDGTYHLESLRELILFPEVGSSRTPCFVIA